MKISGLPFVVTDWREVEQREYPGETGTSHWRVFEGGGLRVRVVDYSPGFRSDHWCPRGHVLYVLEGEFHVDLRDGRTFVLRTGMSFQAGDDEANPHLGRSPRGARVFIVD
jgi:quercetin dioxygenase-like cupin family protein